MVALNVDYVENAIRHWRAFRDRYNAYNEKSDSVAHAYIDAYQSVLASHDLDMLAPENHWERKGHRYLLTRDLQPTPGAKHNLTVMFCMLSPSTATDEEDGPTMKRVMNFALRENATKLVVINLFADRLSNHREFIGMGDPANSGVACGVARDDAHLIIAAWGKPPNQLGKVAAERMLRNLSAYQAVYRLGPSMAGGFPQHPLYLPLDAPLELHRERIAYGDYTDF